MAIHVLNSRGAGAEAVTSNMANKRRSFESEVWRHFDFPKTKNESDDGVTD